MKTKLMLLIFSLLLLVIAACSNLDKKPDPDPPIEWDGTVDEPSGYRPSGNGTISINTPAELAWLAHAVNGTLPGTTTPDDMEGYTFKLMYNFDLMDKTWPMIGSVSGEFSSGYKDEKPFKGTFDGGGYVIHNIKIDQSSKIGVGLFGYIEGPATIKNLRMEGGSIVVGGFIGGIVGRGVGTPTSRITLSKLSVGSGLKIESKGGGTSIQDKDLPTGGIAGSIFHGDMKYSYNDGANVEGSSWLAGVIACLHSGDLKHAFNTAVIFGTGEIIGGVTAHSIKGGSPVVGNIRTFNVFNSGTVSGTAIVGGVLAWHELGTIFGTFNTGTVTGITASTSEIAGETGPGGDFGGSNYILKTGYVSGRGKGSGIPGIVIKGTDTGEKFAKMLNDASVAGGGPDDVWVSTGGRTVVLNSQYKK